MTALQRTPLTAWHEENGGRMVDFAGYLMPVQYQGVLAEHRAVRGSAGLFDISHMAEIFIEGAHARAAVDALVTNNVAKLERGKALYTALCNESGRVLDDLLVYCLHEERFLIVANASNRSKVVDWIGGQLPDGVAMDDQSDDIALLAVQGPNSLEILRDWEGLAEQRSALEELPYYSCLELELDGRPLILSRTGYTGERGYEIYLPADAAPELWRQLMGCGQNHGLVPIGLGARDTLRLEACFCLYGHELDEEHTPYEAGIGWVVRLKAGDFVGKEALLRQKQEGIPHRLQALHLEGRAIGRQGARLFEGESERGVVTSGTFSPSLERSIAIARVEADTGDGPLSVEIRGRRHPATRVEMPFVPSRARD